ncbi:MAG: glycosyltransferase [Pseudomonadota bacterium]
MAEDPFTLVVTSCGRFDLLTRTLNSLFNHLDEQPVHTIIIDDSGDPQINGVAADLPFAQQGMMDVIVNRPQLGQMASIDRAYASVKTPLIFHCEDDWEFFRKGFLAESRAVLDHHPDVSVVGLRDKKERNPLTRDLPEIKDAGPLYCLADPAQHAEYFSYTFNPGLRRLADALRIGPFAALGYEPDVSYAFKQNGFREAHLARPATRHIGEGRHVDDPYAPKRPKNFFDRLKRSGYKRFKRLKRHLS